MAEWAQEEGYVQNGDIKLHYVAAGPPEGEPVLLMHGFPQFSYLWRYHLPALAAQGYRVIAPDLRGYHLSDRPKGVEAYRMQHLVKDIGAFYKTFGWKSANIVAHDWGGAISWLFCIFYPDLVKRFVAIDIPHPSAFRTALQTMPQIQKSWYIWFFQPPEIPERVIGQNLEAFFNFMMFENARPGTFSDEDKRRYLDLFAQPGQLEAALNFYRASTNQANVYSEGSTNFQPLKMPVLLIHGQNDIGFDPLAFAETAKYCAGYYRAVELPGISHWAVEEAPEEILKLILEHLKHEIPS